MGITSSTVLGNIQFDPPAKPEQEKPEDYSDWPDVKRANLELFVKNLFGLFPPRAAGESSGDEASAEARFVEFMTGGGCKDVFNALGDCERPRSTKCKQIAGMLLNCMCSDHRDYYQPVIALLETSLDKDHRQVFHEEKERDESFDNLFKGFKKF